MHSKRLVLIGASWGGVAALREICRGLPANFDAPVCIVLHVGAHPSILPEILTAAGPLPAFHATDGQRLEIGRILVAPPDHHMRIEGDVVRVARGPKEHHSRPAIDPLFRSAALAHRARVIGVVLTGKLNDGTAGMQAIKLYGGTCVVQDPREAEAPSMPSSVLRHITVDHCVRLKAMASLLCNLAAQPVDESVPTMAISDRIFHEDAVSRGTGDSMQHLRAIGNPSTFTCPDCKGALWDIAGSSPQRFLCHTGHAFSLESLTSTQALATDEALWSAIRALQEKRALVLRAMEAATREGDIQKASRLAKKAEELQTSATTLRALVQEVAEET